MEFRISLSWKEILIIFLIAIPSYYLIFKWQSTEKVSSITEQTAKKEDCQCKPFPKPTDCEEVMRNGNYRSGIYVIMPWKPRNSILKSDTLKVFCDMETSGGGWTALDATQNCVIIGGVIFCRSIRSQLKNDYCNNLDAEVGYRAITGHGPASSKRGIINTDCPCLTTLGETGFTPSAEVIRNETEKRNYWSKSLLFDKVIQRRGDAKNAYDYFDKTWQDYKTGFGKLDGEFWLGNDNIFALTNQKSYSVRFDLQQTTRETAFAEYGYFWIDEEAQKYRLHIEDYSGDAGDALKPHNGEDFYTNDKPGNKWTSGWHRGGWWMDKFPSTNLNGLNLKENIHKTRYSSRQDGITWHTFGGNSISLFFTEIKIRSREFSFGGPLCAPGKIRGI